ncbi:hypothetical protein FZEAL_10237 [Fusarium zealandicum]|uniref:Uncharacterized protein n=1 Tax=Fusarium zealandicum TaxID=1053134 RepID=A0A8H4XBY1_9HYPO|nr:hypothetical protein FZEAL_10237 [Fusarium zealandicum]
MPRRDKSGRDTDSFNIRWHSVASVATPSADIMSSPDPLNDTVDQSVMLPSSTRRITRSSQRSNRFSAVPGTSPRKQMFELEVGDNQAPQRLLVTVETEEPSATAAPGSARRKLFQTSSPLLPISRRREMATTTTVPLKNAIEEESADPNATPRKRGRPRKTNGTPLPGAGTKRKSGTPISRTPRRARTTKATERETPGDSSAKPTPKRRGRPPKNRAAEPSSEPNTDSHGVDNSKPVEGWQRQTASPEVVIEVAHEASELPPLRADDSQADNEVTLIITPSEAEGALLKANRPRPPAAPLPQSEADSDIWMATLDDEPTPRPASRTAQAVSAPAVSDHEPDADTSDFGDYGYLAPAGSDVSSADEPDSEARPRNNDTISAGEDFSMIFMDSLPSLQANLRNSVQEITENDIGEETSMIINNTLESLRQSLQDRDKPNTNQETTEAQETSFSLSTQPREELRQSTIRPPLTFSPNRNISPRWLRSPRGTGLSPLRHQVLKLNARETIGAAPDVSEGHGASMSSAQQRSPPGLDNEEPDLYDDSFSEIPGDVLEAATPRRRQGTGRVEPLEEDVEMADELPQPGEEETRLEEEQTRLEEEQTRLEEEQTRLEEEQTQLEEEQTQLGEETRLEEEETQLEEQQSQLEEEEELADQLGLPTASSASRSDAGRLPTPDNTPPQIDGADNSPGKSAQTAQTSVRSASPRGSSPKAPSPEVALVNQAQVVPEIVEEVMDEVVEEMEEPVEDMPDQHQDLPELAGPRRSRLSLDDEAHYPEVTPLNQMTSPLQEPQSMLPEAISDKVLRPQLSPIVRAGRALQSVTSDPPSPEAREHQLRSPFRRSVSRESGPRETSRRSSASPGRSLAFLGVTQIPPGNEAYEDPFSSGTRHTGQASFMEALERSVGESSPRQARVSSKDSTASSMRFHPGSEDEMSWVANEGPISDNLRGDVPLEAFARPAVSSVASASSSHGQMDGTMDEVDDEPDEGGDEMDIWEFEAEREVPRSTQQRQSEERRAASPVHKRSALPSPWRKQTTSQRRRDAGIVAQRRTEPEENQASVAHCTEDAAAKEPAHPDEYSLLAQKEATQQQDKAPESANKASRFDLSSFFSSPAAIPGMLADKFLPAKKMSVFGARPTEPEQVEMEATLPTSSMFPQLPQKEFQPRRDSRTDLFSPARASKPVPIQEEPEAPGEDTIDEDEEMDEQAEQSETQSETQSVAQKRNFAPRPRQPSQGFFKAPTQPAAPVSAEPTPPRMQLSHADIQKWQQETSNVGSDSPGPPQSLLRPLPPRNASPSKSSLRSPLKPHTPGRVVEFTSNVLSPVEQAKARHQRRLSNSSAASQSSAAAQRPPPGPPPRQTANKENHMITTSNASAHAKPAQPEHLSMTLWTRQHWLLLDELLQLRRQGPYDIDYERRSDKYLGKMVRSQGEVMTLQRWHLDCVDAFKAEVGGWDEAALAKRLFALIIGEERRNRGVVNTPARVMFH